MKKEVQEFQVFKKRGKQTVIFFCLTILCLIFAFLAHVIEMKHYSIITIFLFILSLINFVHAILLLLQNFKRIKYLESSFLKVYNLTNKPRIVLFHKLIDENLFEYHFQPIINAKTGEVFAYEILMRTDPEIGMLPLEILDIATNENKLYEIEKFTFINSMRILKDNSDIFNSKKLFINSVSSHLLNDLDFQLLYQEYGTLFENIVLEITEGTLVSDAGIKSIQKRLHEANCQLALDDYGTGYSNESNLLKTNPNYIKIDRALLSHINTDTKKQHLVSNLINFAYHHNIKIIAEGIETYEEFKYVIHLGVDFIQGFYTAKPNPVLLNALPDELIETILALNRNRMLDSQIKKVYEAKNDVSLSLPSLILDQYTDVVINQTDITLHGSQGIVVNLNIQIPDNMRCSITLDEIILRGNENPSITLGHNCCVTLYLNGDNEINYDGIRVPETSELIILGDGNLSINSECACGVGIGGNSKQSYGNITLSSNGTIKVVTNDETAIGIGGAQNNMNSLIRICSGKVFVEAYGRDIVAIGSLYSNARVKIEACVLDIKTIGMKTVGIGCLKGSVTVESYGDLNFKCEGRKLAIIGSIEKGTGTITIVDGKVNFFYNAYYGVGIGSIGGSIDVIIQNGDINIYSEGIDIVGIGDSSGSGVIHIYNGIITPTIYAPNSISIGNSTKTVIIEGGNIQCNFAKDVQPVNAFGVPLVAYIIKTTNPFEKMIVAQEYSYEYRANYSYRYSNIKVYLPAGILL